jgi:hypothetical protein
MAGVRLPPSLLRTSTNEEIIALLVVVDCPTVSADLDGPTGYSQLLQFYQKTNICTKRLLVNSELDQVYYCQLFSDLQLITTLTSSSLGLAPGPTQKR